jgi:hypothetical protein
LAGADPPEDGIGLAYINVAEAARMAAGTSAKDAASLQPLFELAEHVLVKNDRELRRLIAVGFFEDMQNYLQQGVGDSQAVLALLGPRSSQVWSAVEAFCNGDLNALKPFLADQ